MPESGKSGPQKGAENVATLRRYLEALQAGGQRLPQRGGKVNLSAISIACGFDRNVLYTNAQAIQVLEEAVAQLGLELPAQEHAPPRGGYDSPDHRDRRILQLEQANTSLKAENGSLRAERNSLRDRLRRLEHIEAHMVETGRRVVQC